MCPDELMTADLMRIFEKRDAERAKKAANTVVKYRPKAQAIEGIRAVGSSYLEYSPEEDEFVSSGSRSGKGKKSEKTKNSRAQRNAHVKGSRDVQGERSRSKAKSGTRSEREDLRPRPKNNTQARRNASHAGDSRRVHTQDGRYRPKHAKKTKGGVSPVAKTVGGVFITAMAGLGMLSSLGKDKPEVNVNSYEPPAVIYESDSLYDDTYSFALNNGECCVDFNESESGEITVNVPGEVVSDVVEEAIPVLTIEERLDEIFANDPDARTAFNDIEKTINNMTNELGEDAVSFIRTTRDTYAPNVSIPMMICIFEHESSGRMKEADGSLLLGSSGDTGIGQVTPKCEEDVNGRLNPDGRIRYKEDAHDNIEIAAISLQDHCKVWGYNVCYGEDPDNLDAIPYVLSSYNAGDGTVRDYGIREKYVSDCFDEHLYYMLKYPEFATYFGCEDFID